MSKSMFLAFKNWLCPNVKVLTLLIKKLTDESLGKTRLLIIACKRSLLQNDVNRRTSVFYSFLAKPDYAVSFSNSSAMIWNNSHYLLNKKLPWNFNFPLDTSKGYFDFRWRKLWKTTFCRYIFATAPTRIKTLNLICALNQQIWI